MRERFNVTETTKIRARLKTRPAMITKPDSAQSMIPLFSRSSAEQFTARFQPQFCSYAVSVDASSMRLAIREDDVERPAIIREQNSFPGV